MAGINLNTGKNIIGNKDEQFIINFLVNRKMYNQGIIKLNILLEEGNISDELKISLFKNLKLKDLCKYYLDGVFLGCKDIERKLYDKMSNKINYIGIELLPLYITLCHFLYKSKDNVEKYSENNDLEIGYLEELRESRKKEKEQSFIVSIRINLEKVLKQNGVLNSEIQLIKLPGKNIIKEVIELINGVKDFTSKVLEDELINKFLDSKKSTNTQIDNKSPISSSVFSGYAPKTQEELDEYMNNLSSNIEKSKKKSIDNGTFDSDLDNIVISEKNGAKYMNGKIINEDGIFSGYVPKTEKELDEYIKNKSSKADEINEKQLDNTLSENIDGVTWYDDSGEIDYSLGKTKVNNNVKQSNESRGKKDDRKNIKNGLDDLFGYVVYE